MKPMARMGVAIKRALAISDLDRCCAIWWLYRLHFGITGNVMLGLTAVTVAQERSRCAIALVQMKDLGSRAGCYGSSQSIHPLREERLAKG
ncbi:hypothetical protein [Bradyrhizobium genosp. SA-3]|uniref:hypothetical protein n=2 Tax=Nitrobacteraceae TaxID=41294 RepID=UPI001FE04CBE|nr:hypothetical protein [Bradyrhizobium genosp. SA-3]